MGRSRSWTPCLNYESKSSKLQHDATAAATPCGVLVRTSTYTGISCGVEVSKSVLFLMLEHLYGHRAGANVRNSRRAAGSRERGRHDVRGWHGNSIPEGFNSLSNLEQASDKRDANHVPPVLVATDRNSVRSRWYIGAELWALVAVDHLIYAFVSCTSSSGFARRQLYRACEARTVLPTSASRGF